MKNLNKIYAQQVRCSPAGGMRRDGDWQRGAPIYTSFSHLLWAQASWEAGAGSPACRVFFLSASLSPGLAHTVDLAEVSLHMGCDSMVWHYHEHPRVASQDCDMGTGQEIFRLPTAHPVSTRPCRMTLVDGEKSWLEFKCILYFWCLYLDSK